MDKFIIHTLLLIFSLFVITDLHADTTDNAFRCSASKPTSEQNINVNILDCSYLHQFTLETFNHSLFIYPIANIGQIITDDDRGNFLGGGLGFGYYFTDHINFFVEGGTQWHDDYQFGEKGVAYKDYGGPWQFFGKIGSSYQISSKWQFGYAYVHMSNGNRYSVNPSFNGHSLFASYQF
ncbi:acyloxyacyl hydrolase [Shewanella sp. VB17]|uniref:acyloxyacyl hydrolase n=1 Tax=Shewanella sp. VB17 TaxID=2739432 RepID=UPI0015662978|nr:acyloxyacyl hydrolase [Shewanella sp. VB17]NRD72384.1 acyloxyacyl hydrolase [Shewanella sp. VB17]